MNEPAVLQPSAAAISMEVGEAEYARLLGMPRGVPLQGEIAERARAARGWYAAHGTPWLAARRAAIDRLDPSEVTLESGERFASPALASRLIEGGAHALLAVAVTSGAEADARARQLWEEEKPDESFFLSRFATAVAERLVFHAMMWHCRGVEAAGETVLPHLSPGCGGWSFGDQETLMRFIAGGGRAIGPLRMLESGMISPQNSLLAAFGVTRGAVEPTPADACRACDLAPCRYRRAPYAPRRPGGPA